MSESQAGIGVVDGFYAVQKRFYAGEEVEDELRAFLAPDVRWTVPGRSPIAGDHRGVEEALAYFRDRRARAAATMRVIEREVLTAGDIVVRFADGEAELGGELRRWRTVGVFRVADGRITECRLLPFDQYEFDAIWSAAAGA
jgi:ketosteroid isomerase-like protein